MKSKKAQADSFDFGSHLGYYVMVIMLVVILFSFLMILANGISVKFYKSNYGASAMNLEERVFSCLNYKDPISDITYSKVLDIDKIISFNEDPELFDSCLGIDDSNSYGGTSITITYDENNEERDFSIKTKNYVDRPDIEKEYPVLLKDDDIIKAGSISLKFWKI